MAKPGDTEDSADEWGSTLDGREAPAIGVNEDMLRKAIALNPSIKQGKDTVDIMKELSAAQASRTVAQPQQEAPKAKPKDIVEFVLSAKEKYESERKRITAEKQKLDQEEKQLAPKLVERMIDVMLELDPNMTSPQTQEMLKMQAGFFNVIGFSARKVIERKMQKK